jgi:UDP-N-acetylglucosamine:LPS N-acetylglucosamine transferase
MTPPRTAVVISASIGAGHDGAARELTRRLNLAGFKVNRHDLLDLLPAGSGHTLRSIYAGQLRYAPQSWDWLLRAVSGPRVSAAAAAFAARSAASGLMAVLDPAPTVVVSTYPLASQVLGWLRRTDRLTVPAVAFMTDPSVHPLCVAAGVDMHLAPSQAAAAEIRALQPVRAAEVGPVVDPDFRPSRGLPDAYDARQRLALPVVDRLAVVLAGSWGVGDIDRTVGDLVATGLATPVVVCGRNERLRERLDRSSDVIALGWVDDMPSLLRGADVVVHNAGGLSTLEALASGVPVVSYRCLPGHGVANAAVLESGGLSAWPQNPRQLTEALHAALDGDLRHRQHLAFADLAAAPDAAALITGLTSGSVTASTPLDRVPA